MLVELGAVEQRYRAVLEVREKGASVTEVARRYGVARQTVHSWLRRYTEDGMGGLADRSSRPGSCPHQVPAVVEARIVGMMFARVALFAAALLMLWIKAPRREAEAEPPLEATAPAVAP